MEGFLDALYAYAQETRITAYLDSREYHKITADLEKDWEVFRAALTAEQSQKLDALLLKERKAGYLEGEAAFCCALSIGVGLGRL